MASSLTQGLIYKYPLDPTGVNPNNLIVGEVHDLGTTVNRALVPHHSSFYSTSLVVKVEDSPTPLIPNQQYIAAQLHVEASAALDREVCMVVVITDPTIVGKVFLDYQVVGGEYTISVDALRKAIEDVDLDDRVVSWGDIITKPDVYPPAPHLHDIGDLYGFEYLVESLEALRAAILIGDEQSHESLRRLISHEINQVNDSVAHVYKTLEGYLLVGDTAYNSNRLNGYTYTEILASLENTTVGNSTRLDGYNLEELQELFTAHIAPLATHLEGQSLETISQNILAQVTGPQGAKFPTHQSATEDGRAWTRLFSTTELRFEAILTEHRVNDSQSTTSLIKFASGDGVNGVFRDASQTVLSGPLPEQQVRLQRVGNHIEVWLVSGARVRGAVHCQVISVVNHSAVTFSGEVFSTEPDWSQWGVQTTTDPVIVPAVVTLIDNLSLEARLTEFAAEMRAEALESITQ